MRRAKGFDITGQRFGRLTAVRAIAPRRWECRCDCGTLRTFYKYDVVVGRTSSCGCLRREVTGDRGRSHGASKTRIYGVWLDMHRRCNDPSRADFPRYGGRGITVCERWHTFENFRDDMGERLPGKTLDRYPDNNGNYEPGNCRWATLIEQARNTRNNILITLNGETRCLADWCLERGINYFTAHTRLTRRGWSPERALNWTTKRAMVITAEVCDELKVKP